MNLGRAITAGIAGFFLGSFIAVDLVVFGVLMLNSVVVTVLAVGGMVLGVVLGARVPKSNAAEVLNP